MPAANTYDTYQHHTLNDYRVSVEPAYEVGSSSSAKVGAGVVIAAIFLGFGAYLYYSSHDSSTAPAESDTNYPAPAVTDSAAPTDAVDSAALSDANAATTSPTVLPTEATGAPPQESVLNRTTTASKPSAVSTQPAQRTAQPVKPLPKSESAATSAPELSAPTPTAPQPTTVDQATAAAPEQDAPSEVSTNTVPSDEVDTAGG